MFFVTLKTYKEKQTGGSMEKREKNVFGLKVGSNLLTDGNGTIKVPNILSICQQSVTLMNWGQMPFIVSSGAIASEPDTSMTRNLRAVIGQPDLMSIYKNFFGIFGIKCGQLLLTDRDFESGVVRDVLIEAFKHKVVLILNANDGTDDEESGYLVECSDNDRLMKKAVLSVKEYVRGAVIGFEEDGVIDDRGHVVNHARQADRERILSYAKGGSTLGHGKNGAYTKFSVAFDLAEVGVPIVVAPGNKENFLLKAVKRYFGNRFYDFGTLFD